MSDPMAATLPPAARALQVQVPDVWIGPINLARQVLIVAEVGGNHNGDLETAQRLIDAAAWAGVDAVKFQTYRARDLVRPDLPPMGHVGRRWRTQRERFEHLEFTPQQWERLAARCHHHGILFLSTAFDLESLDLIAPWVPAFKVASGDLTHWPLLERMVATGKPLLLSTGMASPEEIARVVERIPPAQRVLLHCVSRYPTPPEAAQLLSIPYLAARFGCPVGYSDHTQGILACLGAVALGARVIEKHFTLDRSQPFGDHPLSAEPEEMAQLVRAVRQMEQMRGEWGKPVSADRDMRPWLRRSLVAARPLRAGSRIQPEDLWALRPGGGIDPWDLPRVVGRVLRRSLEAGEPLAWEDLAPAETPAETLEVSKEA